MLAAYSRQWSPRNLEAPWYELWTRVFTDLVAGHTSLSVCPQACLWYDLHAERPHTTPGPNYILSTEDEQLDEFLDDVGNTTLDSIKSISVPAHRNRFRIPDIAITRKVSFFRPHHPIELIPLTRRVTYHGIPLIAELKQSGARCNDLKTGRAGAEAPMSFARDQVLQQAQHLFRMYPHQDTVVVVAIIGFWWSCMVFRREQMEGLSAVEEDAEEIEIYEERDPTLPDQDGVHLVTAPAPSISDESSFRGLQEELYSFDLSALEESEDIPAEDRTVQLTNPTEPSVDNWSNFFALWCRTIRSDAWSDP